MNTQPRVTAIIAFIFLYCTISCSLVSSPDIDIEVLFSSQSADGSRTVQVKTILGSTTLNFGSARITPWSLTSINEQGDSLNTLLWTPADRAFDTTKVAILIHGSEAPLISMYPLAIDIVQKGLPVLFISMRGTNRNTHMATTLGLVDIADISDILSAYIQFMNTTTIRAAIFGTSLGGVVALNAGVSDERIVAIVCEGIWYNTEKAVGSFLKDSQRMLYEEDKAIYHEKQPTSVFSAPINKPVFLLWGSNDKMTTPEEMQKIVELARSQRTAVQYDIVENGGHSMRYGFPLSQDEAISVNQSISDFMISFLRMP